MKRAVAPVLALVILLASVSTPVEAKPRGCMTSAEQTVEWQIRHGIRLREFAWQCGMAPFKMDTWDIWQRIDKKNAGPFQKMKAARQAMFKREFPKDYNTYLEAWNGRIIMRYREYYLSKVDCEETRKQLQDIDKKGFGAFVTMSAKYKPEVIMDYKTC